MTRWLNLPSFLASREVKYEKPKNRVPRTLAHDEQNTGNALAREKETPRFNGRCHIEVVSYLHRDRDPDGDFLKYALDAIVDRGILRNDTTKEISEIRHRQEIIPGVEQERTEIIITLDDYDVDSCSQDAQGSKLTPKVDTYPTTCTNCIQRGISCDGTKGCKERPKSDMVQVDGEMYVRVSGKDGAYR